MLTNVQVLGYPLYYVMIYFFMYSFLGWCTETVYATIKSRKFINRGFLNGPFCPMYGIASVIIIIFSNNIGKNYLKLYIICFFGASIIEYFTGYILEKMFDAKWWDYSNRKFNIKGRICLIFSVIWGFVGVFILKLIHPLGIRFINVLNKNTLCIITYLLSIYFIFDLTNTIIKLYKLENMLLEFDSIFSDAKAILLNLKSIASDRVYSIENMSRQKINNAQNLSKDFWNRKEVIDNIPKDLKEKYENIINKIAAKYSRIFIAFPQLNSKKFYRVFNDVREKIKSKVR